MLEPCLLQPCFHVAGSCQYRIVGVQIDISKLERIDGHTSIWLRIALIPVRADSLRGSSVEIGTIQRRLAWPLRKDDTHTSRSVSILLCPTCEKRKGRNQDSLIFQIKITIRNIILSWFRFLYIYPPSSLLPAVFPYVCMYIYIYIYLCMYVYIYIHLCIYVIYVYIYIYTHMYVCMYMYIYIYMYLSLSLYIYIYIYIWRQQMK